MSGSGYRRSESRFESRKRISALYYITWILLPPHFNSKGKMAFKTPIFTWELKKLVNCYHHKVTNITLSPKSLYSRKKSHHPPDWFSGLLKETISLTFKIKYFIEIHGYNIWRQIFNFVYQIFIEFRRVLIGWFLNGKKRQ